MQRLFESVITGKKKSLPFFRFMRHWQIRSVTYVTISQNWKKKYQTNVMYSLDLQSTTAIM